MAEKSKIEWTESTWNPIRGCSVVSEGCRNCYAMSVAARFSGEGQAYEGLAYRNGSGDHWTGKVRLVEEHLSDPLRWKRPRRIFVNSMSDLFHESIPDEWIDRIFAVMALAPQHSFQVLTKRPERMLAYMQQLAKSINPLESAARDIGYTFFYAGLSTLIWPIRNVWLGVSVEDQKTADERIPLLLETPAAVRWISAEPLLTAISFRWVAWQPLSRDPGSVNDELDGLRRLDWVVVGGESGGKARRCYVPTVRSIVRQCKAAKVPVFVKQMGGFVVDRNDAGFDGSDPESWPSTNRRERRNQIRHKRISRRVSRRGCTHCVAQQKGR